MSILVNAISMYLSAILDDVLGNNKHPPCLIDHVIHVLAQDNHMVNMFKII